MSPQAYKLVQRHKTASKVIRAVRFEAKLVVPPDYEQRFQEVLSTHVTMHQWSHQA